MTKDQIVRGLPNPTNRIPCAIAIGNFDGVHLGHRIILDKVRSVAVCSPSPKDGRTSVAIGLATALAETDSMVLLIEADLRRPNVSMEMHVESTFGLADLLLGERRADEALQALREADFPRELRRAEALLETRALAMLGRRADADRRWKRYLNSAKGRERNWVS